MLFMEILAVRETKAVAFWHLNCVSKDSWPLVVLRTFGSCILADMPEQDNHDKQPLLSEYDNKANVAEPTVSSPDVRIELSNSPHGNDHKIGA